MVTAAVMAFLSTVGIAPPVPELTLEIEQCAKLDVAEVGRVVAVELRAAIVAVARESTTQASVSCRGAFYQVRVDEPETQKVVVETVAQRPLLELRVDDPLTGKSLRRTIDLSGEAPRVQERLLGIAISELVRASWLELAMVEDLVVKPVTRVEQPEIQRVALALAATRPALDFEPRCGVLALGHDAGRPLWSCGLALVLSGERWHGGMTAEVASRDTAHPLGEISTTSSSGFAHFGAHGRLGVLVTGAELGLRMGVMTVAGHARADAAALGNARTAAWGGPAVRGAVAIWPEHWLGISLGAEVGYAFFGVQGSALDVTVVDTTGTFFGGQLGVIVRMP